MQPKPWEDDDGAGSFGSWLRQQREIRKISLREISDSTKIGLRYLEALEDDRFHVLPATIFAKGFLREYAKYVGLDPDEVVNFYLIADQGRAEEPPEMAAVTGPPPSRRPPRQVAVGVVVVVALLLLVAGIIALVRVQRQAGDGVGAPGMAPPPIQPAPPPSPQQAEPAEGSEEGRSIVVGLSFTAECWVEAVIDDSERIQELRVQGESMQIEALRRVVLTLGNAGAVRVEVNGEPLPLDGAAGEVVKELVIDRAMAGLPPLPDEEGGRGGTAG